MEHKILSGREWQQKEEELLVQITEAMQLVLQLERIPSTKPMVQQFEIPGLKFNPRLLYAVYNACQSS